MKIKQIIVSLRLKHISKRNLFLMKLSCTLYLVCCFQLLALKSFSQNNVTLKLKNASLQTILNEIEVQTSYNFVFNNDEIDIHQKYNIDVLENDIEPTLGSLFGRTSILYRFRGKHIILSKRKPEQESHTLSGTISDASSGETLLGANVQVIGGDRGMLP